MKRYLLLLLPIINSSAGAIMEPNMAMESGAFLQDQIEAAQALPKSRKLRIKMIQQDIRQLDRHIGEQIRFKEKAETLHQRKKAEAKIRHLRLQRDKKLEHLERIKNRPTRS